MSEGPTRLTVRGGRDQFDWNNVKDDKHYQNYLGHSLKAPVGRWQHNKDLEWFNKAGDTEDAKVSARKEELRLLKEAEEDAIATAMGITLPPRAERSIETVQVVESDRSNKTLSHETEQRSSRRRSKSPRSRSRSRSREARRHRRDRAGHRSSHRKHDRSRSRSRDRHSRRHRSPRNTSRHRDYERAHTKDRSRQNHHTSERDGRDRRDRHDDK